MSNSAFSVTGSGGSGAVSSVTAGKGLSGGGVGAVALAVADTYITAGANITVTPNVTGVIVAASGGGGGGNFAQAFVAACMWG